LGMVDRHLTADPGAARQSVAAVRDLIDRTLNQLKVVIYDMRPFMLDDLGLAVALRSYAKARATNVGLKVVTQFDAPAKRLPPHIETALYRIGQEALANVVKHAQARKVELGLEVKPGYVVLTVFDDGKGFDLGRARGQGVGLLSMRERASLVGGQLNIVTERDAGTRIYAVVPLEDDAARS